MTNSTPASEGAKLIHLHQINGRPVRFFAGISETESLPWIALSDFIGAAVLHREVEEHFAASHLMDHFRLVIRHFDIPGGIVDVVPLFVPQILQELIPDLFGSALEPAYTEAVGAATEALYPEFYATFRREKLLDLFPVLRGKGDVA